MSGRIWLVSGALLAALDVALAAFGAHGLRETLERIVPEKPVVAHTAADSSAAGAEAAGAVATPERSRPEELDRRVANYDTAVRYQMYHALGLIALGILMTSSRSRWFAAAGWLFLGGVAIFSGLLYALVFSGPKILGAIVPIGGVAMICGWVALAAGAWGASARNGVRQGQ